MPRWQGLNIKAEGTGVSKPFSKQVNLLGALLGHSIREQLGDDIFQKVEALRSLCKNAYQPGNGEQRALAMQQIRALNLDEMIWILRAYTAFFRLVNNAEKHEISRVNHQRERKATPDHPRPESIADAIYQFKQAGFSLKQVLDALRQLDIQPTLTAHPTEARRRAVLFKLQDIAALLEKLQRPDLTPAEEESAIDALYEHISLMLATNEVRAERMSVIDEVQNGLYFFSSSIWDTVPQIYADIERALRIYYGDSATENLYETLPPILRYRSWIGGDRDGNPFVTPEITGQTLQIHRSTIMQMYLRELRKLRRALSISDQLMKIPEDLRTSLENDARDFKLDSASLQHFKDEPLRLKVRYMGEKIAAILNFEAHDETKWNAPNIIYTSDDFLADLELLKGTLKKMRVGTPQADTHLNRLIIQVRTFGFHLAAIDIRQHSNVHETAIAELLSVAGATEKYAELPEKSRLKILTRELQNPRPLTPHGTKLSETTRAVMKTLQVIRKALQKDARSIGCYIISMTHDVSDVLEVLLLAKEAGIWQYKNGQVDSPLDVVPLLETIEDLQNGGELLDNVFKHPIYQKHLIARKNFQEIMLGYSDSNKDGGYWMANWALYKAQRDFAEVCKKHKLTFRYFHGRGGTVGRGGGRANQAILAMPRNSYTGQIRFTEQGEVISFRYAIPAIARRHLEQIVNAMLQSSLKSREAVPTAIPLEKIYDVMETLSHRAMQTYQQLIGDPNLWQWYTEITPIEHISRLKIASRPVSRKSADNVDFNGLRAIPWVFAWTQTRMNIPGWYGSGVALNELIAADKTTLEVLQYLYQEWTFFRTVVDNIQLEMARTHLVISQFYNELSQQNFLDKIAANYQKTSDMICQITGQKEVFDNAATIKKSIALRNPYTDVLNLVQVELLHRWKKAPDAERSELALAIFLSINGIAAAMQSTG